MTYGKTSLLLILLISSVTVVTAQDESATNEFYIEYHALAVDERNGYGMTLFCVISNDALKIGDMQEDFGFANRELSRMTERYSREKKKVFRFKIKSGLAVGGSGFLLVGAGMIATGSKALEKPGYTLIATGAAFVVVSFAI